ncbi:MAG: CDC27 family protein [Oligoflexia bacterium]|nr:CDC27 family protein [Oligoflexia bacterium]
MFKKNNILFSILFSILFNTNFTLVTTAATAADVDNNREQLLNVLDEELKEVSRLSKHSGHNDPNILLRMAELYLEKARITRDKENEIIFKSESASRSKVNRKEIYKGSYELFQKAQKTATYIVHKHKNFDKRGEVYYIMAFNAKEFNENDKAKKYFKLAITSSQDGTKTNNKANLALAELFMNDEDYREAKNVYEKSLTDKNDKWWTKDAYNLAYAYYKLGDYNRSISLLKEVFKLSSSSAYINMSKSVLNILAVVCSDADRIDEAISFYEAQKQDISRYLIKIAKNIMEKGQSTKAEKALDNGFKVVKSDEERVKILILYLELYNKFERYEKHLDVVKRLKDYDQKNIVKLDSDTIETIISQSQKMSSTLQKQLISPTYAHDESGRAQRGEMVLEYFSVLAYFKKTKEYEYQFFKAETYYALGKYDLALNEYIKAFDGASEAKHDKFKNLSIEGIISIINNKNFSGENRDKYLTAAYERYLSTEGKSQKAKENRNKIFQRLYNLYFKEKKLKDAEALLLKYKKEFPQEGKVQETMLGMLMEKYDKEKMNSDFMRMALLIQNGEFGNVSEGYKKEVEQYLLTLKFKEVETHHQKGEKDQALVGYLKIYNDKNNTETARKNAAYNLAILQHEKTNVLESYKWAITSSKMMNSDEIKKFETSFTVIVAELFNRLYLSEAAKLSEHIFHKLCFKGVNSQKINVFYKNAILVYLADNRIDEALLLVKKSDQCNIPPRYIKETGMELLKSLTRLKRYDTFEGLIKYLDNGSYIPYLIKAYADLRDAYLKSARFDEAKNAETKMLKYYFDSKKRSENIELEDLDEIAKIFIARLNEKAEEFKKIALSYPEEQYNKTLKLKLAKLDELTKEGNAILETGSGTGILHSYKILSECYARLANEIETFIPPGKSPEYIESFKNTMTKVSIPLKNRANDFSRDGRKLIMDNNILSDNNMFFQFTQKNRDQNHDVPGSYYEAGILMDRRGSK